MESRRMLYIFHVDAGRMMTFDIDLVGAGTTTNLKQKIQELFKIPADKQVLLISGGDCLDPNQTVFTCTAGTDSNPIFLFSKAVIESATPPTQIIDHGSEPGLEAKVREHCDMPVNLNTVVRRATLAQNIHELDRELLSVCDNLVHDQHLMQQGWSAAVANLEDITMEFKKRSEIFEKSFGDYMEARESYAKLLQYFQSDLAILQQIPVLPALTGIDKVNEGEVSRTSDENTTSASQEEVSEQITLLDWISAADSRSTMDSLYESCSRGLDQMDARLLQIIKADIEEILAGADNPQMKEVKGLGERLSGLETLMREARKFVSQQGDLAQSFQNNQSRASNTNDPSVLPDLCTSHKRQLQMMAENHQQLSDIKRRCAKAKEELCVNLYHRLRWVMYIEDRILEIDHKVVIYHENLKRLRRHLEVLQQIHLAPATYLCAVAEVVRRRTFSQSFLLWASELACHLLTIHNEEVTRRKEFQSQFETHFLCSLFPGMEDLPPSFATQPPSLFDSRLPKITQSDIDRLKEELPELADNLIVADASSVTNFFLLKSLTKKEDDRIQEEKAVDEKAVEKTETEPKLADSEQPTTTPHAFHLLKDVDRGCESETDTEEFEKVCQSPLDTNLPAQLHKTQDASTSTEDNLQISRSEHEKLKGYLIRLQSLAREASLQLRSELEEIKARIISDKNLIIQDCSTTTSLWNVLIEEKCRKEKEFIDTMQENHEALIREYTTKQLEDSKDITDLKCKNAELEAKIEELRKSVSELADEKKRNKENMALIESLQQQIIDKELEHEKNLKEIIDQQNRDHKVAIENIRSRYKLMTMERSPSDTSLEKSGDFSSLPSHTTLLVQMTENFELDKEKAVNEAIKMERDKWEKLIAKQKSELEKKFEDERNSMMNEIFRKVSEEKDKQIELLMEREKNLNLECIKHKNTIQQLTECERDDADELLERLNILQKEKDLLQCELEKIKTEKAVDLTMSVTLLEGKVDATTSPIRQKEIMSRSEISSMRVGKLNIDTCKTGDQVLILWDPVHESFMILQETRQHMYFLHSDCLESLNLDVVDGKPNKLYCTGEVVDKEYCHARKSENRYKVPKGTKFFRVRVRPLAIASTSKDGFQSAGHPRSTTQDLARMSQSQSTISSSSEVLPEDKSGCQSLPTSPARTHPVILENDELDSGIVKQSEANVERHFAEDSGIVTNAEQVVAAVDATLQAYSTNESETSDR